MNIGMFFFLWFLWFSTPLDAKSDCHYNSNCQNSHARSFMNTRCASSRQAIHQHLWHNIYYTGKGNSLSSSNMTIIYQKSLPQDQTSRYFLINGKKEILISGDSNTQDTFRRDMRAEWIGLPSDFKGTLSFRPEQQQIGCWVEYNQQLRRFLDVPLLENSWINIRLPFIIVDNKLNPRYNTEQNAGSITLQQAFNNPSWCYSKIIKETSGMGLAEIRVSLGKTFIDEDYFQLGYETILVLPTASKQNARYLFDAVVGMNGHAAFGNKLTFQVLLNRDPVHAAWTFFANLEALFMISNHQKRTLDLRGSPEPALELRQKQWSRFLMYTRQDGSIFHGVNVLTREVKVKPYTFVDFSAGWRLKIKKFEIELGYNLWGHGEEKLRFSDAIYIDNGSHPMPFGILGSAPGITASNSTIDTKAADDTSFTAVNDSDFDRHSAAAAAALNHTIHCSVGAIHQGGKTDGFFGIGGFFEIPQKNSALRCFGIWGKIGASF